MFQRFDHRAGHYVLLIATSTLLFLPNLGAATLWDIDEGNNARCACEMLAAENWRVPTFNSLLRVDKPALLYWLQILGYQAFGIGEFAARLPSALAALATLLLTYELGRRLFGTAAGMLAGLILASTIMFGAAAHFANPDALLTACTTLTFFCFWRGFHEGRVPFVTVSMSMGLGFLAKGPVGLVLPFGVIFLFLLWSRQVRSLFERRIGLGVLGFLLVALPWYLWVAVDTKFEFWRGFFGVHNVGRLLNPMENHGGPVYYYVPALILGFAPWSVFLLPVCWCSHGEWTKAKIEKSLPAARSSAFEPHAFLWCWIVLYVVFFSISRTKLPNYILPIYPAVALLTGHFLMSWQRKVANTPAWMMPTSLCCLGLIGVATAITLAVAGGVIDLPVLGGRSFPGLERWAFLGLVPIAAALIAGWCVYQQQRMAALVTLVLSSVMFLAPLAAWGAKTLNDYKAPRALALAIQQRQSEREIRIASFNYSQPSLLFYCGREVRYLAHEDEIREFLRTPLQVFLVTPAPAWDYLSGKVDPKVQTLGRFRDMYLNCDIVVVTNR